jgi:hypothetical protein
MHTWQAHLVAAGIAWVDDDIETATRQYYIASLFVQMLNEHSNSSSASTTGYDGTTVAAVQ